MFARIASNLLKRDNLEEAIQICEHGLKKFSTYAQGHYILAKCYQRKGMNEEARAEFERALKFDFTHINSMKELAKIYKMAGLDDYYKDYLLKLFVIDPLNKEIVTEVKEVGKYDAWIIQEDPLLKAIPQQSSPAEKSTLSTEPDAARVLEPADKQPDRPMDNIYNRDKMDLSQFNNMQDDFTTILQGKQVSSEQGAETKPATTNGNEDWTEDITISYGDDTIPAEQKGGSNADNSGEEIETAVQELSFDEETDKIIEKEQAKETTDDTTQISLNFPAESVTKTDTDIKSKPPIGDETVLSTREFKMKREIPETEISKTAPDTGRGLPLITGEEEEELPFKPPKIISQTLGEILVSQKKYMEAMEVFRILKQKNPDNKNFDKKIEFLQKIIALEKDQHQQA